MELDGHLLNPIQRAEQQAHIPTCPFCQADLQLYQELKTQAIQRWPAVKSPVALDKVLRGAKRHAGLQRLTLPLRAAIWVGFALLMLVLFRWIFTNINPAPAILPPSSPTPISSTPESTPTAILNETVKIPVEPLWRGETNDRGSWSPEDDYLFIPLLDTPPPGGDRRTTSLHFISAATGEDCPASETFLGPLGYQNYAWLDNERVLFIDKEGRVFLFTRCQPGSQDISDLFEEALVRVAMPDINQELASPGSLLLEAPSAYWLLDPVTLQAHPLADPVPSPEQADSFAWIPSGHRISVIQPVAGKPELSHLVLLDLDSGQVLRSMEIEASTEEQAPLVEWLGPERPFIWSMASDGPLMIDLSANPPQQIHVLPELFELNMVYPDDISSMGVFYSPAYGSYHIVVHTNLPDDKSIYLYHGEDGKAEKLAGDRQVLMILPGDQLMPLIPMQDTPTYDDEYDLVWVDRPEQPPIHLQVSGHTPRNYPNLQSRLRPGGTGILFGSTQGISLVGLPGGDTQAFWQLTGAENATLPTLLLTPDGLGLIVFASSNGSEGQDSLVYWLSLAGTPTRQVIGTQQLPAATPTHQVLASPQSPAITSTPQVIDATQSPAASPIPQVFGDPVAQISTYITLTIVSKDDPSHAHWVDYFGGSVDIDGDILVAGAPLWNSPGEADGAAYVYRRSADGDWQAEATLIASDRDDGFQYDQFFGESIAVNGTVIAVGAPGYDDPQAGDNIGAVYIYEYDGHSWVETTKLTSSRHAPGAKIGRMLAYDGNLLAASGSLEAGYVAIFQRETDGWREMADVPVPPSSDGNPYVLLDLYGDTLAVSTITWKDTSAPNEYRPLKRTGIVTLYERDGDQWIQNFQTPPQEVSLYKMYGEGPFGLPVSLGGEADKANLLAVGKPGFPESGRESGSVAIYERGEQGWVPQTELVLAPGEQVPGALPFFSEPGATYFGAFVDFEGNRLAVISTFANTVYIFEHQGSGWVYRYRITTGAVLWDDFQRRTVAMNGNELLLGSPGELGGGYIAVFKLPP
jgi:hypothetical protein